MNYVENSGWKYSRAFEGKWEKMTSSSLETLESSSRVGCQPFLASSSLSPFIFVLRFFFYLSLFVLFRLIIQNFSTNPYLMHLSYCWFIIINHLQFFKCKLFILFDRYLLYVQLKVDSSNDTWYSLQIIVILVVVIIIINQRICIGCGSQPCSICNFNFSFFRLESIMLYSSFSLVLPTCIYR